MTAGRDGSVCEVSGGGEARPALPAKVSVSCYQVRKLHGARAKLHGACKLIRIINRVGLMIPTQTPFQKCILASRVLGLRLAGRNIWICTMVSSADQPSSSQAKLITQRHSRSALAQILVQAQSKPRSPISPRDWIKPGRARTSVDPRPLGHGQLSRSARTIGRTSLQPALISAASHAASTLQARRSAGKWPWPTISGRCHGKASRAARTDGGKTDKIGRRSVRGETDQIALYYPL